MDEIDDAPPRRGPRLLLLPFFLLLVLLAAVAAGCGRRAAGRQAEASSGGKITLDFWNGFTGPDGKTMDRLVRQFEKENPDVAVRMQIIPWSTFYDKVTLALAYGGAPEVFVVHAGRLPEFAVFDKLRPLSDLYVASASPLKEADFSPTAWRATFYDGKQLALPLDIHPIGMYYNTKLFKEAGVVDAAGNPRPPKTWDEFLDAAKKMTRDTNGDGTTDQWGFVITWQRSNWMTFAAQFGGGILTPDNADCAMDSPGSIAASQRMHDLVYKYKVAPKPEGVDAWLAFQQGKAAMALEGVYMLASLEEQKTLPFAGAPVPQFGPVRAVWGGSHLLAQPAGIAPERSRAAWRLMRFLSDHSLAWGLGGQVPARVAVQRSAAFTSSGVPAQFARQVDHLKYEPLMPKMNALYQFVDPAVEEFLLNLRTPEGAMQDACRRIDQVLKRP